MNPLTARLVFLALCTDPKASGHCKASVVGMISDSWTEVQRKVRKMLSRCKQVLCVLLAGILLLGAACAKEETQSPSASTNSVLDAQNPVVVTVWHYYVGENQRMLEASVEAFNRTEGMQHGVMVKAINMGAIADLEEEISKSAQGVINASEMPQVFSSYPDKAMEIEGYGMLENLRDYFTQEELDQYVSDFLADGEFEGGRLLVLPVVKSTELLYLNDTGWSAFAQETGYTYADLESWETVYDTARAYYQWADGKTPDESWDGMAFIGFDSVANYIISGCKQLGIDVIDPSLGEQGGALLQDEVLRPIFEVYYKGMSLGYFGGEGKFRSDNIKAGSLIAYVGSSSSAAYFPTWLEEDNAQVPIAFSAHFYPCFEQGQPYAIQQGAGMCVTASTQEQQAGAALFLKWFTQPQQNIQFAMTTGYLPVTTAAYDSQEFYDILEELHQGDAAQKNVAQVYEIALEQTTNRGTYAAKPFDNSYAVRAALQATLMDAGQQGKDLADQMKAQGASEDEILQALDVDGAFLLWISEISSVFESKGIYYIHNS